MIENEISYKIRGAIFAAYNELGPGLLESVYEFALTYHLKLERMDVLTQVPLPVVYRNMTMEIGFRIDILVNEK